MAKSIANRSRRRSQAEKTGARILREQKKRNAEIAAAAKRKWKAAAKDLRHQAAVLRRLGLYKPKVPRLTIASVAKSGAARRAVRKAAPVLQGKAKVSKVGKRRVVVPVAPGERVYSRAGKVYTTTKPAPPRPQRRGPTLGDTKAIAERRRQIAYALSEADRIANKFGYSAEKHARLVHLVHQYSTTFLEILEVSRKKHEVYLQGGAWDQQQWDYPEDWYIFEEFTELYYYKGDI